MNNDLLNTILDSTIKGTTGLVGLEGVNAIEAPTLIDLALKLIVILATARKPIIEIISLIFKKKKNV